MTDAFDVCRKQWQLWRRGFEGGWGNRRVPMKITSVRSIFAVAILSAVSLAQQAVAKTPTPAPGPAVEAILANPKVTKALDDIKADDDNVFGRGNRIELRSSFPVIARSESDEAIRLWR
jgi:hypothetical protein